MTTPPLDFQIRLKKKQEEKEDKRRYQAQAHLYTIIKVARDEDLKEQIGKDIYFDLVDHDKVRNFRILKQTPFSVFKEEVAKEFGIPVQFQRFWMWAKRQNHTYRPHRPLTSHKEAQSVGQLREVSNKAYNAELKLFLEVELGLDLRPIAPPYKTKEDILLFFKHYDPEKGELRYVGRLFVKSSGKPIEILAKLNQMAGFAPNDEIELYEEIKFEPFVMCEHLDKSTTFRFSQIEDGDIICFQKSPPLEGEEDCRYPDVPSFLEYLHNQQLSRRGMSPSRSSSIEVVDPKALRARRGRDQAEQVAGANEVVQSGTTQQQEQGGLVGEAARTEALQVQGHEAPAKSNEDFTFSVDELVGQTEGPNSASVRETLSILPEVDLTVEDYLSNLGKETPFVPSTTVSVEEHPIIPPSIDPSAPSSSPPHEVITEANDEEVTLPAKRQTVEETAPEGEQILRPSKVPSISASELVGGTPPNEMLLVEVDEATIPGPLFPKQALVSAREALDESVRALDQYRVEVRETLLVRQEVISKQDAEIQQLKASLEPEKKNQALLHELKKLRSEVDRLESERAEFQTQSWEWEGRFKRKNEDFEKLTQESQTQIAALQNTIRARDDEIQRQRKTIQDLEEDKRQMGIQVVELQEKVKDLPEIRKALSDLEKARNQLRDAQDKVRVAEFHRKRAENDRKIAISRFLQSDSYKQRLLADGMRRAVQYYNRALDDAAVKFPTVLANVPKRRLPELPAPPDEFEFVVTREEERESEVVNE